MRHGGLTLGHTVVIGGGICGLAAGLTLAEPMAEALPWLLPKQRPAPRV